MPIPKKLILSGNIYIKYIDVPSKPISGDVELYLHDDAISLSPGGYYNLTTSGYFKAKIYDGKYWHKLNMSEFCLEGENKYIKRQQPIASAELCKIVLQDFKNTELFLTYRSHYTINEYQPGPDTRTHPKWLKNKNK